VNYELEEQILKHGQRVKVLEPKSLRKIIKTRLKEALAAYKNK
jgi:predicted DNA-binding transcriptional regulator YafY